MSEIVIAGVGQIPVGEHWELSLRSMAARAISAALKDAGGLKPQALYVGNLLSPVVSHQANLGALLATNSVLQGIEAFTVEAAEASSAAAFRLGYLAIRSGYIDCALVVGVEKVTDMVSNRLETHISEVLDYDYENYSGLTPNGLAALLMQRYIHEYNVPRSAFADFAVVPHNNASGNPFAYFHNQITPETYH
ncbi:MAG: thiolase domain-containing protein, partial [Anaerolineae bacterium]|nr:thiolase domain-containing protein [Anaerolineae bacterium]